MRSILLGGLMFEAWPSNPDSAYVVGPEGLTGWSDSPGVRGHGGERPVAHGDYDLPVYRTGRVITIKGHILASSAFDLRRMRDRLTGLLAEGSPGVLTVDEDGMATWANVRLAGDVKVTPTVSGTEAAFMVQLRAADPRLYGESSVFQGSTVQVFHRGNVGAFPVVRVAGPSAGYTLWGPNGRRVVVSQPLTAGQWHDFDFRSGILRRDGVLQMGGLARLEPWTVPPHVKTVMEIVGAPSMAVTVTDTYM